MILTHNMAAENNNRQLGITNKSLAKSSSKLSSGYRINSAADDAAGLAISEKMRGQIRGLNQAARNANDGISLIQTAEGAMNEVHSILQRMEELSVEAANDTCTDEDREAIQYEIEHLVTEVDRIADNTEFNTMKLLNGSYANPNLALLQAPAEATITHVSTVGPELVFIELTQNVQTIQTQTGSPTGSIANSDAAFKNMLKTEIVPQAVSSIINAYPTTFGYLQGSSLGIGLRIEDNPSSSTLASVTIGAGGYLDNIMVSYTLTVNVGQLTFDAAGNIQNRDDLEITIIHEMTHALMDETLTTGMLGRSDTWAPVAPFPSWFIEGMAQASAGGCYDNNDWVRNGLGITPSTSLADISAAVAGHPLSPPDSTGISEYGTGYLAAMYLGYLANGSGAVSPAGIAHGLDLILNEVKNGSSLDSAIANHTSYTNTADFQNHFSTDGAQFVHDLVTAAGNGSGGLASGFTTSTGFLPDAAGGSSLFELDTTNDTIRNEYPADYPVISGGGLSAPGTPVSGTGTGGGNTGGGNTGGGNTGGGNTGGGTGTGGTLAGNPLMIQAGANSNQLIAIYIGNISSAAIGINNADVSSHANAENTISAVQKGIDYVSRQRAVLGACQNRLDHAVNNSTGMSENLQASESHIRDTDIADEMVRYSARQILQQIGQSMLAQSSKMGEGILRLLQ